MTQQLSAETYRAWFVRAEQLLGEAREEIDRLNVFPVPDGDTGTNVYLTMEAAAAAALGTDTASLSVIAEEVARGALMGARGNSGVIMSQILRGLADGFENCDTATAGEFAQALQLAADSAYQAVAVPKEGTILTVIRSAAVGAAAADDAIALACHTATDAAAETLARTPDLLPVLREAGVVDAGGQALLVLLQALTQVIDGVEVSFSERARTLLMPAHTPVIGYEGPEYEVMYLLDAEDGVIADYRLALSELGDSVVVVGGRGLWNVHVHTDDIGAAIEAGISVGRPHRIRVTRLIAADAIRRQAAGPKASRALVVVVHGPDLAEYLTQDGLTVVRAPQRGRPATSELLAGATATHAESVIFLPSDKDTTPVAEAAAAAARDLGIRATVIPTKSIVQSLSAIAVHDPHARFDDDVVAMGRAAGATRYGGVTIAAREAMTSAGVCNPGDVLGLIDGDIRIIGTDVAEVAASVINYLAGGNIELITLVTGAEASSAEIEHVCAEVSKCQPYLDMEVLAGGQAHWPFIIGAE